MWATVGFQLVLNTESTQRTTGAPESTLDVVEASNPDSQACPVSSLPDWPQSS